MTKGLVNIAKFADMVCANGHVDPTAFGTCNVVVVKRTGHKCGARMGWSRSTIRAMCKQGRIQGAVLPGNEWLINLEVAVQHIVKREKVGRPKGKK